MNDRSVENMCLQSHVSVVESQPTAAKSHSLMAMLGYVVSFCRSVDDSWLFCLEMPEMILMSFT
jgi:hypothetical protein